MESGPAAVTGQPGRSQPVEDTVNSKRWRVGIDRLGRLLPIVVLLFLVLPVVTLPGGAFAGELNRAGLVVVYGEGQAETFCIAFEEDEISGEELLARTGLPVIADSATALGVRVCQIQDTGCAYPVEHCFCQCMGGGACAYWNYYYRNPGESTWTYSALGAAMRRVRPGSVESWVWGDGRIPPASELTFEAICLPSPSTPVPTAEPTFPVQTATPEIVTTIPATADAVPATSQRPVETPVAGLTVVSASPVPTPAPLPTAEGGSDIVSYWPFGLMVLCLIVFGAIVWLRRS